MANPVKVFIGGLPKDVTKIDIYEKVSEFGAVASIYYRKAYDRNIGGWAFVNFKDANSAIKAIEALNSKYIFPNSHRPLTVKFANIKQNNKDSKQNLNMDTEQTESLLLKSAGTTVSLAEYHNGVKEQTLQNYQQNDIMPVLKANDSHFPHQQLATSIFVFHLPPDWTNQDLYRHFRHFGTIINTHVRRDWYGRNKGFGFVTYENYESAANAINMMNGFHVSGKYLKVEFRRGDNKYPQLHNTMPNSMMKNSMLQNNLLQNNLLQNNLLQNNLLQNMMMQRNMTQSNMTQSNMIQNNLMSNNMIPTSPMMMNQAAVHPPTVPLMFVNQQPQVSPTQPNIPSPPPYTYESMDMGKQTEQNNFPINAKMPMKREKPMHFYD